jgi:hypothetical protein
MLFKISRQKSQVPRQKTMTINKDNYEIFFLDYHEKNLTPEQVAELLIFLEVNPELKKEFEAFSTFSVNDNSEVVFEDKEKLKKPVITTSNFNHFAVDNLEGDLLPEEKIQYKKFVAANSQFKKEEDLFSKTKLKADLNIKHPDKNSLRHKGKIIPFNFFYVAAAACILLMLGIFFSKQLTNTDKEQTAQEILILQKDSQPKVAIIDIDSSKNSTEAPEKKVQPAPITNSSSNTQLATVPGIRKKKNIKDYSPHKAIQENNVATLEPMQLIETKQSLVQEEHYLLRLKSLHLFPVYILDEYYAAIEPVQLTPALAYEKLKKDAVKKFEKSRSEDSDDWFADDAFEEKKKTRFIDVVASALNKISGKKVQLQPEYNNKGEMIGYDFSAGAFNYKKDLSK